ncbi:MAG: DNA methyltransferase [Bacteroidota bacterium]|nr:DNA methyltransferase [Bacteroidota bacterium]
MALSWNEIKENAQRFSKEWEKDTSEDAEAKSFMDEFFAVFGVSRRRMATFEYSVKKNDGKQGFIDLLWKGVILIEFKSRGKDLEKAHKQAIDYFPGLKDADLPKYILVSDFERFKLFDLDENTYVEFKLNELVQNVQHFGFIAGYQKKIYKEQDPVNIKAADLMGKLHDRLKEIGYDGHPLEVYLVRLLFCLFAEDTTIFEKQQFQDFIYQRTNVDGSDLAARMQELFQVLNTPPEKRFKNLDEELNAFPYVNGKLFEEQLPMASFDSKMRTALLECCYLDWSMISPAIFGSMFQSVMNPVERRNLGAHYTSEKNILKLIKPLFLDNLYEEFEKLKATKNIRKLDEFHKRLGSLKFLDPACGCGNFLVITYRELRLLELEILKEIYKKQLTTSIESIIWLDVDMMYGIEYEEFPARIAEVAMWLMDHQMNMLISNEFGQYFARLPLKKAAKIIHGNALQKDWETVVSKNELTYILGNPPFIGKNFQTDKQKDDLALVFDNAKGLGNIDYVTGWYVVAARYIKGTKIKVAFVSTNSITQGEQVGLIWPLLFNSYGLKIHFAHRTFKWSNEAKGNAAVHVVIIGFANFDISNKIIFEYDNNEGEPHAILVKNINPYLVEAKDICLMSRTKPICKVPEMINGSKVVDGGYLLFTEEEKNDFLFKEPKANIYIKKFLGSEEYINNINRYCLWLKNADPKALRELPFLMERIGKVKEMRENSKDLNTQKKANSPTLFMAERQPFSNYLLIPRVSSENRKYIPIGYLPPDVIISDRATALPNATLFEFGIITSLMHMVWMKYTCGRMKSDYNYSNSIVYNNYPWPLNPEKKQITAIEIMAQKVLDARLEFPNSSLADLYDPLTMPPSLVKAHSELDKAVDLAYRPQPFISEAKRMEFLFELYEQYTANLFTTVKVKKNKK